MPAAAAPPPPWQPAPCPPAWPGAAWHPGCVPVPALAACQALGTRREKSGPSETCRAPHTLPPAGRSRLRGHGQRGGLPAEGPVAGGDGQRDTGRGTGAEGAGEGEREREQVSRLWVPEVGAGCAGRAGWQRASARLGGPLAEEGGRLHVHTLSPPPPPTQGPWEPPQAQALWTVSDPPHSALGCEATPPCGQGHPRRSPEEGAAGPSALRKRPCPRQAWGVGGSPQESGRASAPRWPSLAGWIRGHTCACPGTAGVRWGLEGSRKGGR